MEELAAAVEAKLGSEEEVVDPGKVPKEADIAKVSAAAVGDLEKALSSEGFRQVDEEMWQ